MPNTSSPEIQTEGVKTLLDEPKKAIIRLALPMIVAMSVQTIYNFVDAIWVSGLGADALSAVGFFFPFFFMTMAIATGIGLGGGSAISRRIGARDKIGADNVAVHTVVIMFLAAVFLTVPLFIFAEKIFTLLGAGRTLAMAVSYARIMFAGTLIIFFANIANAILRSEGDVKRAMFAMVLGAAINIVLDPIFIYTFGLGVAGAAWATILSLFITSLLLFNWLFLKKDSYVSFSFGKFRFNREIVRDILRVGLPASAQQLSMSFTMLMINLILVRVGGTDGVAIYVTGWRVATIAILPLLGIATAVVSVSGAAFGQGAFKKINIAFMHALKIGIIIEVVVGIAVFFLAPQITAVFTRAQGANRIASDLIVFLRIMCFFYPATAFGMFSSSMFQGVGKGINALIATIVRTVLLTLLFTALFTFILDMGLMGVWFGIVMGNTIGAVLAFLWAKSYIRGLSATMRKVETPVVAPCDS
ncbi:MATE family efflux transporter [Candidatus Aerophobetes bacterium Ae_b3a]|nr:MAG: MATE family efflux transporter [Candidatus Aerophobetes bacterium Ae_b3a]